MDTVEKRTKQRRTISRIAHIATGLGQPLQCQMNDISEAGARIAVLYPKAAAQEFLLVLNTDLLRWCRVVWRSEHEIGVSFIDPPKSLTTPEHSVAS
jgi:hypothetical protein